MDTLSYQSLVLTSMPSAQHLPTPFAPEAMPSKGRMGELASNIQVHTTKLEEYLASQDRPFPSLGVDAVETGPLPPELTKSREIILESIDELHALTLGPLASLMFLTAPQVSKHNQDCYVYLTSIESLRKSPSDIPFQHRVKLWD